jgi:hypothetical protein
LKQNLRTDPEYQEISFNEVDKKYNCDRKSLHGPYAMVKFNAQAETKVPLNPVGRTGIYGRGHLGRWGPNHAAGMIEF